MFSDGCITLIKSVIYYVFVIAPARIVDLDENTSGVAHTRASRLFACSGVQRSAGVGELLNCHPQCNAAPVGGGPSLGNNLT
jgi:hypothetical protein